METFGDLIRSENRTSGREGDGALWATVGLGLFSVGLGVAELVAPRGLHRLLGIRPRSRTLQLTRGLGARELAAGLGLLVARRPAPWLWARVAGDVIDLAVLGAATRTREAPARRMTAAFGAVAAIAAIDVYAAVKAGGASPRLAAHVRKAITVGRPVEEVFAFFKARVASAELTAERSNELIAWRSSANAEVASRGEVRFRPAEGGGTSVTMTLAHEPRAGALGQLGAPLARPALAVELDRDLRRFKQLLELGEIVHSDASVHAGRHAARPAERSRS